MDVVKCRTKISQLRGEDCIILRIVHGLLGAVLYGWAALAVNRNLNRDRNKSKH